MSHTASLSKSDLRRIERLAEDAGTTPQMILKTVLRDGFEYTEWFVRRVVEGDANLKASRMMSTEEALSFIEKQRALRSRKSFGGLSGRAMRARISRLSTPGMRSLVNRW